MKVFKIKASGRYCEGLAIVAAPDLETAVVLASEISTTWPISYSGKSIDESAELPLVFEGTEPQVVIHFESGE